MEAQPIKAVFENPLCRDCLVPIPMIRPHGYVEGAGRNMFSQINISSSKWIFVCYHISLLAVKVTHSLSKDHAVSQAI